MSGTDFIVLAKYEYFEIFHKDNINLLQGITKLE